MNEIRMYVERLFLGKVLTEEVLELKEEIYGNLVARYEDYVAGGMDAAEALRATEASITSVDDELVAAAAAAGVCEDAPVAPVAPIAPVEPAAAAAAFEDALAAAASTEPAPAVNDSDRALDGVDDGPRAIETAACDESLLGAVKAFASDVLRCSWARIEAGLRWYSPATILLCFGLFLFVFVLFVVAGIVGGEPSMVVFGLVFIPLMFVLVVALIVFSAGLDGAYAAESADEDADAWSAGDVADYVAPDAVVDLPA